MHRLLFVCTGNYYRSRFAEIYFQHLAKTHGLESSVWSRGLELWDGNENDISINTLTRLDELGISDFEVRAPIELFEDDLRRASRTIALSSREHKPLFQTKFPKWVDLVEYWDIEDIHFEKPEVALGQLQNAVVDLIDQLTEKT